MAYLLAINGLYICLIYGIILGLERGLGCLFNSFSEAPSFLCFLTFDFPVWNFALSPFDWHSYFGIPCSVYVELICYRTFARSSSLAYLHLIFYSIFLHFLEYGCYLRGVFSSLISHSFIYSMVPPTLSPPWRK